MEGKVMTQYEPHTAKKIYLYRNGTEKTNAKLIVINERQIRDFGTFLSRATSGIKAPVAVRNIYTPSGGHKIRSLEKLVNGRYYVAGGTEQFKRVKYGSGPRLLPQRQQTRVEVSPPRRGLPALVAASRYKRPVEKPFVIHVFRNGDELFRGVRVLLPRRIMGSWEHVLELITEKTYLYTPAKRLCTLDGQSLYAVSELQDGGKYVAIEGHKPFKKVAYCATDTTKPLLRSRRNPTITLTTDARRISRYQHPPITHQPPAVRPHAPPVDPMSLLVPDRRKHRPMAGRKNKEARERALLENRDDSVFGGSPTLPRRRPMMPSPPPSLSTANLLQEHPEHKRGGRQRGHGEGKRRRGEEEEEEEEEEEDILRESGQETVGVMVEGRQREKNAAGGKEEEEEEEAEEEEGIEEGEGGQLREKGKGRQMRKGGGRREERRRKGGKELRERGGGLPKGPKPALPSAVTMTTTVLNKGEASGGGRGEEEEEEEEVEEEVEEEEEGRGQQSTKGTPIPGREGEGERREEGEREEEGKKESEREKEREGGSPMTERGGGRQGEREPDTVPADEEVEQPVDQAEAEEVIEEEEEEGEREGAGKTAEKKEEGEEEALKIMPAQDLELQSQPLQTSIDLTMNRVQPTAISATNEGGSRGSPTQSNPTESGNVGDGVTSDSGDGVGVRGGGEEGGGTTSGRHELPQSRSGSRTDSRKTVEEIETESDVHANGAAPGGIGRNGEQGVEREEQREEGGRTEEERREAEEERQGRGVEEGEVTETGGGSVMESSVGEKKPSSSPLPSPQPTTSTSPPPPAAPSSPPPPSPPPEDSPSSHPPSEDTLLVEDPPQ